MALALAAAEAERGRLRAVLWAVWGALGGTEELLHAARCARAPRRLRTPPRHAGRSLAP